MAFPIVLAHGIARFDLLSHVLLEGNGAAEGALHYFRGIRNALRAAGFDAHHSSVSFAAGVDVRSRELKANIERVLAETRAEKIHIIAHSMGGLDARHMLFDHREEGFQRHVASLTTIGTPHLGTTFADWGVDHSEHLFAALGVLGIDSLDGFRDLTTRSCRAFDVEAEDFERSCGVRFQTYAGVQELPLVFAPLKFSWSMIFEAEGANDGLVSHASAQWRPEYFRETLDADHLNQVGWWDPDELGRLFERLRGKPVRAREEFERYIRGFYVAVAQDLEGGSARASGGGSQDHP